MQENTILIYIKLYGAIICTFVVGVLGGWDIALRVLFTLTAIDILTGWLAAGYTKTLSSNIGYQGIIKKIGLYLMIALAVALDQMFNTQAVLRSGAIGFYIAIEGLSILENLGRCDVPLPKFIKTVLLQLKDKSDNGSDNNEQS